MDVTLIRKKLQELERYVRELDTLRKTASSSLQKSLSSLWSVEHGLQLAIQTLIDIGNHILAAIGENRIEDYVDVIDQLGKHGIIPQEFSKQIRDMAGFRNILVHEYAEVDIQIILDVLQNRLSDFTDFSNHIQRYLKDHGGR